MAKKMKENEFFPFVDAEERDSFTAVIVSHGIKRAAIEFAGSGDSGQVDSVTFYDADGEIIVNADKIPGPLSTESYQEYDGSTKKYITKTRKVDAKTLGLVVEAIGYTLLESTDLDWFNNEGGEGTLTMEFGEDGKLAFTGEVSINYMETEDHSFEWRPYKE